MSAQTKPLIAILLTGIALLSAACAPQQPKPWPGAGQNPAIDEQPLTLDLPENTGVEPVEQVEMTRMQQVPVLDEQAARRLARLELEMGGVQSSVSGLEGDVAGLQKDMTDIRPRVAKAEAMEKHFRALSLELDRINRTYDMAPAPSAKIVPAPQKAKAAPVKLEPKKPAPVKKIASPAVTGPLKVNKVRVGEQPGGKTRIVLDTSAPAKITQDIDNGEKILVVELPGASWAAQKSQNVKSSALVSSYTADEHDGGSRLIVQLKSAAKVVSTTRLDPADGAGYRVVLDLAKN